jgi:4-hydroxythreonine-4-phosphate dehydrogenase
VICLLVADDLTGAADACVKFVAQGFSGAVLLAPDRIPVSGDEAEPDGVDVVDVLAINLDTRRLKDPAAARRRVRETARFARSAPPAPASAPAPAIFKKIDSTLRGHVGAEIDEAMATFGCTHAIVAPSFPAMGRIVRDGRLIVVTPPGSGAGGDRMVCDVPALLSRQGLRHLAAIRASATREPTQRTLAAELTDALASGARVLVCDAVAPHDLDRLVSAASDAIATVGGHPLWVGSAGLASAVATRLARQTAPAAAATRPPSATAPAQAGSHSSSSGRSDTCGGSSGRSNAYGGSSASSSRSSSGRSGSRPGGASSRSSDRSGSVLLCIGSTHAVTREQTTRLLAARDVVLIAAGAMKSLTEATASAATVCDALARRRHALVALDWPRTDVRAVHHLLRAADLSESPAATLNELPAAARGAAPTADLGDAPAADDADGLAVDRDRRPAIAGFVMSGGDTAADICLAMGAERLCLGGEVADGIPWGRLRGGRADGLPLVLKAGGFGGPDTLVEAVDFLTAIMPPISVPDTLSNRVPLTLPLVAITMGDPAGIGPEVVLKALADPTIAALAQFVIVGDRNVLEATAATTGIPLATLPHATVRHVDALQGHAVVPGTLDAACGRAAIEYVRDATEMCLRGEAVAMVTAPINKEAVALSGREFSGHTEFIAELCRVTDSRMMLANPRLSVVHVSTHIALRDACELATPAIVRTIELGHRALRLLGNESPRIAVCGLNPHAGEHGLFGREEEQIVIPALEAARARGIACQGPFAPDTIFIDAWAGHWDLVVVMYHDQGHIPMKLLDFANTVNVTLGIPIVRTSVDHGTAFNIAGCGLADPTSMKAALRLGARMGLTRAREASSPHPSPH